MRILLAVVFATLTTLGGCASEFHVERAQPRSAPLVIAPADSVYVVTPPDGHFGDEPYPGSGGRLAGAVVQEFAKHAERVDASPSVMTEADGLAAAKKGGFARCVVPTILQWENRATEWTGKRDALTIRVIVYDAGTGRTLDTATVWAKGTWWTLGGDHPEDLLSRMMAAYSKQTFEQPKP